MKFTHWHIRLNIHIWKTKSSSDKQYLLGHFWRNAIKTDTDQSIRHAFLVCLKRNISQTCKSSKSKSLSKLYITDKTWFDEYFLYHVITQDIIFCANDTYCPISHEIKATRK